MLTFEDYINNSEELSTEEFFERFGICWSEAKKSFKKFEALQFYQEGSDSPMHDYLNNDIENFIRKMKNFRLAERESSFEALCGGIQMQRVHLISSYPITKYLEFEYYTYLISNSLGESIRIIDQTKVNDLKMRDFVMFDDEHILIQKYTNDGVLTGGYYVKHNIAEIAEDIRKKYDECYKNGSDFRSMFRPDMNILEQIL